MGGGSPLYCAERVSVALKSSGGIFERLPEANGIKTPWTLESELMDLYFPGNAWWKLNSAY